VYEDRFYTQKHEWVELDGGKPVKGAIGTAGITEFAQVHNLN
jgi:glycine cleavage system H lipoate-binding protein